MSSSYGKVHDAEIFNRVCTGYLLSICAKSLSMAIRTHMISSEFDPSFKKSPGRSTSEGRKQKPNVIDLH